MSLFKNIESLPQTYTTSLWQSQNKTPMFNSLFAFYHSILELFNTELFLKINFNYLLEREPYVRC